MTDDLTPRLPPRMGPTPTDAEQLLLPVGGTPIVVERSVRRQIEGVLDPYQPPELLEIRGAARLLLFGRVALMVWAVSLVVAVLQLRTRLDEGDDGAVVRVLGWYGFVVAGLVVVTGWWWSDRVTRNVHRLDGRLPGRLRCVSAWAAPLVVTFLLSVTVVRLEPADLLDVRPMIIVPLFLAAMWRPYALVRRISMSFWRIQPDGVIGTAFVLDAAAVGLLWWGLTSAPTRLVPADDGTVAVLFGIALAGAVALVANVLAWVVLLRDVAAAQRHRGLALHTRHDHRQLRLQGIDPMDPEVRWAMLRIRREQEEEEARRREAEVEGVPVVSEPAVVEQEPVEAFAPEPVAPSPVVPAPIEADAPEPASPASTDAERTEPVTAEDVESTRTRSGDRLRRLRAAARAAEVVRAEPDEVAPQPEIVEAAAPAAAPEVEPEVVEAGEPAAASEPEVVDAATPAAAPEVEPEVAAPEPDDAEPEEVAPEPAAARERAEPSVVADAAAALAATADERRRTGSPLDAIAARWGAGAGADSPDPAERIAARLRGDAGVGARTGDRAPEPEQAAASTDEPTEPPAEQVAARSEEHAGAARAGGSLREQLGIGRRDAEPGARTGSLREQLMRQAQGGGAAGSRREQLAERLRPTTDDPAPLPSDILDRLSRLGITPGATPLIDAASSSPRYDDPDEIRTTIPRIYLLEAVRYLFLLGLAATVAGAVWMVVAAVSIGSSADAEVTAAFRDLDVARRVTISAFGVALVLGLLWCLVLAAHAKRAGVEDLRVRVLGAMAGVGAATLAVSFVVDGERGWVSWSVLALLVVLLRVASGAAGVTLDWFEEPALTLEVWRIGIVVPLAAIAVGGLIGPVVVGEPEDALSFFAALIAILTGVLAVVIALSTATVEETVRLSPGLAVPVDVRERADR